jgi:hypothetical protein
MKPTIEQVIKGMETIGAVVFREPFSVNLFGVRTNENRANTFNDWGGAFYWDDKGKRHELIIPITTDAGVYFRRKPMNKLGTAIIVHNKQYRSVYNLQDNGHRQNQKAFRQIKPMDYWRDNNKDSVLDMEGKIYTEIAHTNFHYMGRGVTVDNWSAGCVGASVTNLNKLFAFVEVQKGRVYSFTLLHETIFAK